MKDDDDSLAALIVIRALTRNVIEYLRLQQIQNFKVDNKGADEPDNEQGEPDQSADERPRGDLTVVK
jgi:hypothetical protein